MLTILTVSFVHVLGCGMRVRDEHVDDVSLHTYIHTHTHTYIHKYSDFLMSDLCGARFGSPQLICFVYIISILL